MVEGGLLSSGIGIPRLWIAANYTIHVLYFSFGNSLLWSSVNVLCVACALNILVGKVQNNLLMYCINMLKKSKDPAATHSLPSVTVPNSAAFQGSMLAFWKRLVCVGAVGMWLGLITRLRMVSFSWSCWFFLKQIMLVSFHSWRRVSQGKFSCRCCGRGETIHIGTLIRN